MTSELMEPEIQSQLYVASPTNTLSFTLIKSEPVYCTWPSLATHLGWSITNALIQFSSSNEQLKVYLLGSLAATKNCLIALYFLRVNLKIIPGVAVEFLYIRNLSCPDSPVLTQYHPYNLFLWLNQTRHICKS